MESAKPIHPVDLQVGQRVRARRKALGVSQQELAAATGVTFQQIQKYENGKNRISASKLYEIAQELKAPIEYFFSVTQADQAGRPLSSASEVSELLSAFMRIDRDEFRRSVVTLVTSLANASATSPSQP